MIREPGIILLVPGSVGFQSVSYLFERDTSLGMDSGILLITLLISLVAFMATFLAMSGPANVRLIRQFQARQIEDGITALQQQGPDAAAAFIARRRAAFSEAADSSRAA